MYPILPGITQSDNRTTDSTTNRWNSTPHLDNPIVGVDTIRVRGLHNGHDLRHKTERTLVDPTTGEIRVVGSKSYDFVWVNGHKVALQADNRQGGRRLVRVFGAQGSPANERGRSLDPGGG